MFETEENPTDTFPGPESSGSWTKGSMVISIKPVWNVKLLVFHIMD